MLYLLTRSLDGLIDDLAIVEDPSAARVVLLGSKPADLSRFPSLRGVFRAGAGTDNVPWDEARQRGIEIGLPSPSSLAILYEEAAAFASHLILHAAYAGAGSVTAWTRWPRPSLLEKTVLVVGAGHIGGRVARNLQGLTRVTTFDARRPRSEIVGLLRGADVVSLHVPLADNTRGLIGAAELSLLRDGAAIVNISRGPLVDEQALLAEIQRGRIRAAFDVFWEEPYTGPLAAFHPERFYMTPHVAGSCREFLMAAALDLRAFVQGVSG